MSRRESASHEGAESPPANPLRDEPERIITLLVIVETLVVARRVAAIFPLFFSSLYVRKCVRACVVGAPCLYGARKKFLLSNLAPKCK